MEYENKRLKIMLYRYYKEFGNTLPANSLPREETDNIDKFIFTVEDDKLILTSLKKD